VQVGGGREVEGGSLITGGRTVEAEELSESERSPKADHPPRVGVGFSLDLCKRLKQLLHTCVSVWGVVSDRWVRARWLCTGLRVIGAV